MVSFNKRGWIALRAIVRLRRTGRLTLRVRAAPTEARFLDLMSLRRITKRMTAVLAILCLLSCVILPVHAEELGNELSGIVDPEGGLSRDVLTEIGGYDGAVEGFGARVLELLKNTLGRIGELGLGEGLRTLGLILAAALLCALLEEGPRTRAAAPLVGGLSVAAACVGPFGSLLSMGTETIRELHAYTELLLPGMGALMAVSGNPASAAVSGLGIVLFDLLQGAVSDLLAPLLSLLAALTVAEYALGLDQLGALRDFLRWLLVSGVKLLMWGYSAVLTATGLVSAAVDAQKLRSLRTLIAGMTPVVGNLVSEASASLLGAASALRTASGLYGMLAVLGICLGPFFRMGLQYLLLKLAGGLCGLFGKGGTRPLLEKLTEAVGLVLSLTGVCCLLSLMILVLCIRTVNP